VEGEKTYGEEARIREGSRDGRHFVVVFSERELILTRKLI
jgi:hypothetical protein